MAREEQAPESATAAGCSQGWKQGPGEGLPRGQKGGPGAKEGSRTFPGISGNSGIPCVKTSSRALRQPPSFCTAPFVGIAIQGGRGETSPEPSQRLWLEGLGGAAVEWEISLGLPGVEREGKGAFGRAEGG